MLTIYCLELNLDLQFQHCLLLGNLQRIFIAMETLLHEKVSSLQGWEQAASLLQLKTACSC